MATNGKLEARITVPTGGWDVALTDQDAGPTTVTIPAGTYYHSSAGSEAEGFADTFATLANAAMGQTWVSSVAAGEAGTGKYTLSCGGSTCTVTFTDTEVRDLMGFTGNLTGSTSYTSSAQAEGLWLPEYPYQSLNGGPSWNGWWETDQKSVENAAGYSFSVIGQKKRINSVTWPIASRAKCWVANEGTANESFEQFLLDGIWAGAAWGTSAGPIRFHGDADTDATFATYAALGLESWRPEQIRDHWTGAWVIVLPRLVEVPT